MILLAEPPPSIWGGGSTHITACHQLWPLLTPKKTPIFMIPMSSLSFLPTEGRKQLFPLGTRKPRNHLLYEPLAVWQCWFTLPYVIYSVSPHPSFQQLQVYLAPMPCSHLLSPIPLAIPSSFIFFPDTCHLIVWEGLWLCSRASAEGSRFNS